MDRFFESFRKGDTFNIGINSGIIECTFVNADGTQGIIQVTDREGVFATIMTRHIAFVTKIVSVEASDGEPAQV